jgi:hypothetical protein
LRDLIREADQMSIQEAERRQRQRRTTHTKRKRNTTAVNGDEPDALVTDNGNTTTEPEELIADAVFRKEVGRITRMTLHRWDKDPRMKELGLPARILLNGRGFRTRQQSERFKQNLIRRATAARGAAQAGA